MSGRRASTGVHAAAADQFRAASDLSSRVEDRLLAGLVSASQTTAQYAEAFDAVPRVCPTADDVSTSDAENQD